MQFSYSQEKTIKGIVSDSKGSISGANIVVRGTKTSTQSDFDGSYSIKAKVGDVLVFSFIGMDELTRKVESSTTTVNMTMRSSENNLVEVVVTGQGIKKAKKALGYGQTTIKSEDFASKPSTDVARALTGKAAGVNIAQTSGLSGSGTNIIIRGYSSITGSNQPLFVVDGIPFNSETNSDGNFIEGATNASSRFLDLDPNSIESISILKGLSATTLYGSAGRSGVILVTTKSGNTKNVNKKMEVSFSQSLYNTRIASLPDYQDKYGNGFDNSYIEAFSNWGPAFGTVGTQGIDQNGLIPNPYPKLDGDTNYQEKVAYKPYNNVKPFFKTGYVNTTSVNVNGKGGDTSYNLSFGNTSDEGFIDNNSYRRLNLSTGGTTKLSNGFTFSTVMNYVRTDKVAPPTAAGFGSNAAAPSVFANILYTPRSIDLFGNPYEKAVDKSSYYYRSDIPNPLWTLRNSGDEEAVRRFFGNFTATYEINSWSNLSYRLAIDNYTQTKKYYINKGNGQSFYNDGYLRTSVKENTVFDHTFSYNFDTKLDKGGNFNFDGTLGFNPRLEGFNINVNAFTNQFIYGFTESQNFLFTDKPNSRTRKSSFNKVGFYGSTTIGYKKYLYLNLQGRKDYFSSLQKENNSLFYPSASLSFIPTDALSFLKSNKFVNFLKLRVGYGSSAGFPDPYQTIIGLDSQTKAFLNTEGKVVNTLSQNRALGNLNLRPELVKELEFGLEGKFFNNRIGIDFSAYNKVSTDLIVERELDPSSGYDSTTDNVAQVSNKGIEISLNLAIFKSSARGFGWNVTTNFSQNINIVDKLGLGSSVKSLGIAGFTNLGNFAVEGRPYGVILGSAILRDVNGSYLVGGDGNYLRSPDLTEIGDPNAKWKSTVINEFTFRNVTFAFQFEFQKGGDIYSTTAASLISRGSTKDTEYDRSGTVVLPGVKLNGNVNDIQIGYTQLGFNNSGFFINEQAIYDATNLRLREVSISYSLPKKYLDKTPFGKISMSIVGNNMWFKAFNFPKYLNFDPEVLSLGVGNGQGFDYLTGPTAKRFGFNFNLTF